MFGWLKRKIAESPNTVVTGPGVLKTHDVEARFRADGHRQGDYYGKLAQSRWSDGQERFSFNLRKLPADHDGKVRLFKDDAQVAEFDLDGTELKFRWKGMSSDDIPKFEIGDNLRMKVGSHEMHGIVEPD